MDGSIRFNNDINVEVAVDPTAAEGARLTGAKNLVDGQELGAGSDLPIVTEADAGKVLAVNASGEWAADYKTVYFSTPAGNISYNIAKNFLTKGIIVICGNILDNPNIIGLLIEVLYNSDDDLYVVVFSGDRALVSSNPDDDQMEWD